MTCGYPSSVCSLFRILSESSLLSARVVRLAFFFLPFCVIHSRKLPTVSCFFRLPVIYLPTSKLETTISVAKKSSDTDSIYGDIATIKLPQFHQNIANPIQNSKKTHFSAYTFVYVKIFLYLWGSNCCACMYVHIRTRSALPQSRAPKPRPKQRHTTQTQANGTENIANRRTIVRQAAY